MSKRLPHIFSSRTSMVCGLTYLQLCNLFWTDFCVWWKIVLQFYSFVCVFPVFSALFIEDTILSSIVYSWLLCCKLIGHICIGFYFWAF